MTLVLSQGLWKAIAEFRILDEPYFRDKFTQFSYPAIIRILINFSC